MKKAIVLFVLALCPFSALAQAKKEGPKETLWAKVNLHVDWNKRNEDSGGVRQGVMNLSLSGTLKLNRAFSGKVDQGRFSPLLSYALQNATFNYNYKEDYSINRQDNPPKCPNPQRTMQKTGSMSADQSGAPMNLIIHYNAGFAEGASRLPIAPPPETKDVLIDYYEFFVLVPAQKAEGKSKVFSSETKSCKEIDQSGPLFDGRIDIYFKMGPNGKMSGSKSWSSQSLSSTSSVAVSDLPETFKKKPEVPKPGGKNDVHYSLTWDLDAAPEAQIEHETGGYWFDITGIDQEVVVGQKIHLKGLVAPRSMDPESGKWTIGNESSVKPIKKFEASSASGHVIRLDPKDDLEKKEVTFFFTREGESEVTFKAQNVTAKVKFKVKKPAFDLIVTAAQSNTYGPLKTGLSNKGFDCCGSSLSAEDEAKAKECEKLRKEIEAEKDSAIRGMLQKSYDSDPMCPVGLQYDGITFQAVPKDDTASAGEVQYVQLVRATTVRTEPDRGGWSREVAAEGIDGCYPYPLNLEPYGTKDTPGFTRPISLFARSYTMYLMFRPKGEGNEWVPLKMYLWDWQGALECDASGCRENKREAIFPSSGSGADADEYPEWDFCSDPGR